ncbi:hypothetical protein Q7P36_009978 [Cladosporium allicinum]
MAGKYNDPTWEHRFIDDVEMRRLVGADTWHRAPTRGVQGACYYGDNSNNGHGQTSNNGHGHTSSNGYYGRMPHQHSRHGPVESPSVESPVSISMGGLGSSSSLNPRVQAYQPQGQHGSGNSYNAQPRAVLRSDQAPQAQLGAGASWEKAERMLRDPRHGTRAPTSKRERKKLTRQIKNAAKAAKALSEAGGDGVTASPEREDGEKAGYAESGISSEHVESQGLAESCLIWDDQAAARRKADLDESSNSSIGSSSSKDMSSQCPCIMQPSEGAVCDAGHAHASVDGAHERDSSLPRSDSFDVEDELGSWSRRIASCFCFSETFIEYQQEDVMRCLSVDRKRSPRRSISSDAV